MHPRELKIEDYTYQLPDDRIAHYPLEQRDASQLLVYKDGEITTDVYRNIAGYLPEGALMVFNQTRVVHARLPFSKPTGGAIEIFCLEPHSSYKDVQQAMLQRGQVWWNCLVGSAKKWKDGMVLELVCAAHELTIYATMVAKAPSYYTIQLDWNQPELTFAEVLHIAGKVPLPPYINRDATIADEERYQTIFARAEGSVAAPTAGLHFTPEVLASLADKHIDTAFVTLHVGAGTFKPVKSATMDEHDMHAEWIDVSLSTVQQLFNHNGSKIVATGTTSLRTLESLYHIGNKLHHNMSVDWNSIAVEQWDPYEIDQWCTTKEAFAAIITHLQQHEQNSLVTRTQILIAPGYTFRAVDGLVTNFHQPQSTLLLLVAALIGEDWRRLYTYALEHNFRFLSYGDGGLLWR